MTDIIGKPMARKAKPIIMTFYDRLRDYPYTSTFFVQDETPDSDCLELINAVCALSLCVLGKYTIGYKPYFVPDFDERIKAVSPYAMGTFKWAIKYRPESNYRVRTHTIPGKNIELALNARLNNAPLGKTGKNPDPEHPLWIKFVEVFRRICVSEEGEIIPNEIELGITASNWPPKGAKKRR